MTAASFTSTMRPRSLRRGFPLASTGECGIGGMILVPMPLMVCHAPFAR